MTRINTLDLPAISRFSVGFDRILDELTRATHVDTPNYPPYSIIQHSDTEFSVEMAVAGFSEDELSVEVADGKLIMSGEKVHEVESKPAVYLYQGISTRRFSRSMQLAENINVLGAVVKNGLLIVSLERIIPEELKPRKIAISVAS